MRYQYSSNILCTSHIMLSCCIYVAGIHVNFIYCAQETHHFLFKNVLFLIALSVQIKTGYFDHYVDHSK